MEKLEKVELVRVKTGASYDEAKAALEACDYDVLDALIYLEKLGKIDAGVASYTTTVNTSNDFEKAQENYENSCKSSSVGGAFNQILEGLGKFFKKCCDTTFVVSKHDKTVLRMPVIILLGLLVFAFWLTIPLLIVGLCFEHKYYFEGVESTVLDINDICEKASETVGNIKNDLQSKDK